MIEVTATHLYLDYQAEIGNDQWIVEKLKKNNQVTVYRVFTFMNEQVVENNDDNNSYGRHRFILGELKNDYYRIDKNILGLKHDLFLYRNLKITWKMFVAEGPISIFRKIDRLIDEQIIVGGNSEKAISAVDFEMLIKHFPTKTTLRHYANSRISMILKDYLGTITDAQKKLEEHFKRQGEIETKSRVETLHKYEIEKYRYIYDNIIEMLKVSEAYSEDKWQKIMVSFLLLLFPKYVAVLEKVHIKDFYTNQMKPTSRYIDLTLVDVSGNIDIIEIKKPFLNCLLSSSKYRGNYTPKKDLAGAVMQAEKYIFHLNKWGVAGEKKITKKRASELPKNMQIRITNPKAMIVIGRDKDFENDQRFDFEIIKRKYANMIDIMTYDDLLKRLTNVITMLERAK